MVVPNCRGRHIRSAMHLQYIEHLYEPNLWKNPIETAEIGKWTFSEMQGGQAIGEFLRNQPEP